jgi:hypothetical protein
MVIFQTADGSPGYNQFESVDEAVKFVEKLRNEQGIENARMFALEEIKFELKPYYRVELQALTRGPSTPSAPSAPAAPASTPAPAPVAPSPAPSTPAPAGPMSSESTPFGSPAPPPQPEAAPSESQPTRRGLFGR